MEIEFRPHHFLCTLCFQGRGYSPAFVANFTDIVTQLKGPAGDDVSIKVVSHTDSICQPCPHRLEKKCESEEKISILDNAHANALGFKPNDTLTWGEAKKLIQENITLEKFHQICSTCSWKEYGICEAVLTSFLNK